MREERRSFGAFAIWSAALLVAGSIWAFPQRGAALLLAAAGVGAAYLSRHMEPGMLEFHGATFLAFAAVMAGLPGYLYGCLGGTPPAYPTPALVIVSICAVAALMLARPSVEGMWRSAVHLALGVFAVCSFTALLLQGVFAGAGTLMPLEPHHIALLRTFAVCIVALTIAFAGPRWSHLELTHLAYAALVLAGVKLLFEDLRNGHMGFMALSIALFAMTLIGVPRLLKLGAQRRSAAGMRAKNTHRREISA